MLGLSGGPGSGKGTQCARIIKRYPDFVHVSMGDIIREEISTKGTADEKWGMISQLVSKGEMAPEVRFKLTCCLRYQAKIMWQGHVPDW